MNITFRSICVAALAIGSFACSRQHPQQPATSVPGGQATQAAAPAAVPSTGANPEPVDRPSPVEATIPPEPLPAPPPPASAPRPAAFAQTVAIPAGTRIHVRMGQTLDTKYSRAGERFVAYLDAPVISGGRVIVPKGTAFQGHVVQAKSSGRLKGRAYLEVRLDSFRLHGATYSVRTAVDARASASHKNRNFAFVGGGVGTGATIGALAGGVIGAAVGAGAGAAVGTTGAFLTGKKNVRLPVETQLVFALRGAVALRG